MSYEPLTFGYNPEQITFLCQFWREYAWRENAWQENAWWDFAWRENELAGKCLVGI